MGGIGYLLSCGISFTFRCLIKFIDDLYAVLVSYLQLIYFLVVVFQVVVCCFFFFPPIESFVC